MYKYDKHSIFYQNLVFSYNCIYQVDRIPEILDHNLENININEITMIYDQFINSIKNKHDFIPPSEATSYFMIDQKDEQYYQYHKQLWFNNVRELGLNIIEHTNIQDYVDHGLTLHYVDPHITTSPRAYTLNVQYFKHRLTELTEKEYILLEYNGVNHFINHIFPTLNSVKIMCENEMIVILNPFNEELTSVDYDIMHTLFKHCNNVSIVYITPSITRSFVDGKVKEHYNDTISFNSELVFKPRVLDTKQFINRFSTLVKKEYILLEYDGASYIIKHSFTTINRIHINTCIDGIIVIISLFKDDLTNPDYNYMYKIFKTCDTIIFVYINPYIIQTFKKKTGVQYTSNIRPKHQSIDELFDIKYHQDSMYSLTL